jgi:hypothetical protein
MDEEISLYLLTIKKDNQLFANVYQDKDILKEAICSFSKKYPLKLFMLTKSFGNAYDLAVAEKDDELVVCLGPKKDIPDNTSNVIKCKKKEIEIENFLSGV